MRKQFQAMLCSSLILAMTMTGCGDTASSLPADDGSVIQINSMEQEIENITHVNTAETESTETALPENPNTAITDFALQLLQSSLQEGENTLVSPLSVLCALGMAANGADGETLAQMEQAFGISLETLNRFLHDYNNALPRGENYRLAPANAIWLWDSDNFIVQDNFLQANEDWYGAALNRAPFDETTIKEINDWVKINTEDMIPEILTEIPSGAVMYLVNALAFDAEWETVYRENQVRDGIFTTADGTGQQISFMYSEESLFLEEENAVGFVKYYADDSYAFAALLPDEGISLPDYTASLNGEKLQKLLENPQQITVNASIPKFQCEYSVEMSEILTDMGITDAFDPDLADFSRLVSPGQNIYISRVLHKTYIAVDERGTKAGAATAAEISRLSAPLSTETKTVYLDRPFVYMLIDCEENLPVFIGTLERPK